MPMTVESHLAPARKAHLLYGCPAMRVDGKPPLLDIACRNATHQKLIDSVGQRPLDMLASDRAGRPKAVVRALRQLFDAHRVLRRLGPYSFHVTQVYELRRDGAPLYALVPGAVGASHALDAAAREGLPRSVLSRATQVNKLSPRPCL